MNFYELEDSLQPRVFILSCNENALVIQTTTEQSKIILRNSLSTNYYDISASNAYLTLQLNSNIITSFSYNNQRANQNSDLIYLNQLEIQPSSNLAQFSSNAQLYYTDGVLNLKFPSSTNTFSVNGNIVSGGTIYASNLQITGDTVVLNTVTSNTEQVVITNLGSGPALKVTQEGANNIAEFYDDATLTLLVADGGTVGIRTSAPLQTLDVRGNQYISGSLGIGTTQPLKTLDVQGDINFIGNLYQSNILYKSSQWTSNIETKTLYYNDGYIGIGTTNTQNNHIYVFDNKVDTHVYQILESTQNVYVATEYNNANGTLGVGKNTTSDDNGSGYIATYDNKDLAFGTNNIYRGRFTADGRFGIGTNGQPTSQQVLDVTGGAYISGNVGIGTTNPLATLAIGNGPTDVTSTLMFNGGDDVTNVDKLYWTFVTNGSKIGHSAGWNVNHYAGQAGVAEGSLNGNFHFFTGGNPSYNERFTILNSGNIGIGSTTPQAILDVQGQAVISGNVGIGTTQANFPLDVNGIIQGTQLKSSITTGTAPFIVSSTTQVNNLNAQYLGGNNSAYYLNVGNMNAGTLPVTRGGTGATTLGGQYRIMYATGATGSIQGSSTFNYNYSTGNLGIGTVTPRQRLELFGGNAIISGNVGIGTTVPLYPLHVEGQSYLNGTVTTNNNNINAGTGTVTAQTFAGTATQVSSTLVRGAYLTGDNYNGSTGTTWAASASTTYNGASVLVARDASAYMYASGVGIGTDTARKLLDIQGGDAIVSGNIGIGTTLPRQRFDLQGGDAIISGNVGVGSTQPISAIDTNRVRIYNNSTYGQITLDSGYSPSSHILYLEAYGGPLMRLRNMATFGGGKGTTALTLTEQSIIFYLNTYTTERMRIDQNGNVGIGTASPLYKLHVEGASYFNGTITGSLSGTATQVSQNLTRGTYLTGANYNGSVATTWNVDGDVAATANKVAVRDASAYLFASGVGIGTATARAPIDVIGNVLVTGNIGIGTTVAKYPIHLHSSEDVFTVNNGKLAISYGSAITPSTDLEIRNSSDTSYTGVLLANDGNVYPTASLRIEGKRYDQSAAIAYAGNMGLYRYNNNAALNSNLPLGLIHFGGNHTSGSTANRAFSAYMGAVSEENFTTSSNMRTAFVFASTSNAYDYFNTSLTHTNEIMRLNSYGNLGIGTTLPKKRLDVQGDINFTGSLYENNALYVSSQWTSNMSGSTLYYNGNVGIGTTIAAAKLDVRGNSYLGKGLNGVYNSFVGGPFHKQEGWDTAGTSHTITYPNYCVANNSSGTIHIQVKSATADKLGNASVSFLKANAANVDLFNIHYHKTANLTTFTIAASTNDISITTDSDCAIAWSSIGSC